MTKNCLDNAILLEVIAGVDGLDDRQRAGTPFRDQVPSYSRILQDNKAAGVKGMRIGILKEGLSSQILDPGVESKFLAAASIFKELGATVEEVSIPMHEVAPAIFSAASRQGGAMGRTGKASGRRQVMLTDLYEKMLPYTAATIDKVSSFSSKIVKANPTDECRKQEYGV